MKYNDNTRNTSNTECRSTFLRRSSSVCFETQDIGEIHDADKSNNVINNNENDNNINNGVEIRNEDIFERANNNSPISRRRSSSVVVYRRYSLTYREEEIDISNENRTRFHPDVKNNDGVKICNEDPGIFEKAFGYENVDLFDNNLTSSSVDEDWKVFSKAERHLSLSMNFDTESCSSNGVGSRRASIGLAKFISEKLNSFNATQAKRSKIEQSIRVTRTTVSPSFLTGNLANYYMMMKDNLCEAIVKSEETRAVVEKMNEDIYKRVPRLRKYMRKKVLKKSQPHKYILRQRYKRPSFPQVK